MHMEPDLAIRREIPRMTGATFNPQVSSWPGPTRPSDPDSHA